MKNNFPLPAPDFNQQADNALRQLRRAVSQSRKRLLERYRILAPDRGFLVRAAWAKAECQAWLSPAPALIFADLAELHLADIVPESDCLACCA